MEAQLESDEARVKRLLPGFNPDEDDRNRAWTEWQTDNGQRVLRYITRHISSIGESEDIYQDTMLIVSMKIEKGEYEYRENVPLEAYVFRVADMRIWKEKERCARQRADPLEQGLPSQSSGEVVRVPEEIAFETIIAEDLRSKISELPENYAEVLSRCVDGKTISEIASELGISEENVRQQKSRGIKRLQTAFA